MMRKPVFVRKPGLAPGVVVWDGELPPGQVLEVLCCTSESNGYTIVLDTRNGQLSVSYDGRELLGSGEGR